MALSIKLFLLVVMLSAVVVTAKPRKNSKIDLHAAPTKKPVQTKSSTKPSTTTTTTTKKPTPKIQAISPSTKPPSVPTKPPSVPTKPPSIPTKPPSIPTKPPSVPTTVASTIPNQQQLIDSMNNGKTIDAKSLESLKAYTKAGQSLPPNGQLPADVKLPDGVNPDDLKKYLGK